MRSMMQAGLLIAAWFVVPAFAASPSGQHAAASGSPPECSPGMAKRACQRRQLDALMRRLDEVSAQADAQRHDALATRYARAIQAAVTGNWLMPDGLPDATCRVDVVQSPGGKVEGATVDAGCPYDDAGRRSVVNAVLRTQTLPYKGYEAVFEPHVVLTFVPPGR